MANEQNESVELVVDFSEAVSFDPIPVGWYGATITEAKAGKSQAGNAKISLMLEITGGEADEAIGRKLFDDLVLEGKGTWKTKQMLEAVFGEATVRLKTGDLLDAEVEVRVVQKVWREEDGGDGEPRSRITRYRQCALSSGPIAAVEGMFAPVPEPELAPEKRKGGLFKRN